MTGPLESFDADWLTLREPADAAARSPVLAGILSAWLLDTLSGRRIASVVDFGAGTGSAMRWLAPRLPVPQSWRLVDGDAGLLERAKDTVPLPVAGIETTLADLRDADMVGLIGGADVLSASALLDLVSAAWIDRLVAACAETGTAAWLTLSVDGADAWFPALRGDWAAGRAFARDQARDKGFGPSLGPAAVSYAALRFRDAGFKVGKAKSDWRLGPGAAALQQELLRGHALAAMGADPARGRIHEAWAHRRLYEIAAGRGGVRIGHTDLLALPA
ncbi:class I SAM-dependent methyltransferase [Hwanghaeella grinnelliae]|uniref:Class I SAM-dependent methyltransferase n=1 Tax=Hwanghaeella grinnelliae TaxID=2500179 RepID=A0A3S2VQA6_9PROT|nr:class I SAM-dependent methyltransferase [Hwanghaeella grinnelliae]RVU39152.1 class I SAM-dependent methyltransferase [Hwanghaeella grinnelliae]